MWRNSLVGVLQVIQNEKANFIAQKEQELREVDAKVNGAGIGTQQNYRKQRRGDGEVDLE